MHYWKPKRMLNRYCVLTAVHYQLEQSLLEQITGIKIIGIDNKRPPRIRKEPYIDIFFELSLKAPKEWCDDFNRLGNQLEPSVKINKKEGRFIEAWVRKLDEIPRHLNDIKTKITTCNEQYIENIKLKELAEMEKSAALFGEKGEQGRLNQVLANLNFNN